MRWPALQWLGLVVMAAGFARLELWVGVAVLGAGILIAGVAAELGAARH